MNDEVTNYEIGMRVLAAIGKCLLVVLLACILWFWLIPGIQSELKNMAKCNSVGAMYGGGECYGAGVKLDMDNLPEYVGGK